MVKVLVATTETQGARANDYAYAVDGELVYVPLAGCQRPWAVEPWQWCAAGPRSDGGPRRGAAGHGPQAEGARLGAEIGGDCGCGRGFAGMASNRFTTTAMVVERFDLDGRDLWTALSDSLERQGRLDPAWTLDQTSVFRQTFQRMLATAAHFSVGSIVERQGDRIRSRAKAEPLMVPSSVADPRHRRN